MKTTAPTEQVAQISTTDERGAPLLSVLVKRTYALDGEACFVAPEQLPLLPLRVDPDEPEVVLDESDLWPIKRLTDVVVRGHAYAHGARSATIAAAEAGDLRKEIAVIGDRRATLSATGRVIFSDPEPFERIPLRYQHAYGGVDRAAEARRGNPFAAIRRYAGPLARNSRHSPYRYPRNGVGKGFVVEATREALAPLALPNLEDPSDRLTPERLAAGSPRRWPTMPLPWCTDWASMASFPRYAYLGCCPDTDVPVDEFAEVRRGYLAKGFPRPGSRPEEMCSDRVFNAGSLGLQLDLVTPARAGGLVFRLQHLHPEKASMSFKLPAGAPAISVDGRRGKLVSTDPVLHHVVIEPDIGRVSVVWRGAAPALRRYDLDELEQMPLQVVW